MLNICVGHVVTLPRLWSWGTRGGSGGGSDKEWFWGSDMVSLRKIPVFDVLFEMVCFGASWVAFQSGHACRMSRLWRRVTTLASRHDSGVTFAGQANNCYVLDELTGFGGGRPGTFWQYICEFSSTLGPDIAGRGVSVAKERSLGCAHSRCWLRVDEDQSMTFVETTFPFPLTFGCWLPLFSRKRFVH